MKLKSCIPLLKSSPHGSRNEVQTQNKPLVFQLGVNLHGSIFVSLGEACCTRLVLRPLDGLLGHPAPRIEASSMDASERSNLTICILRAETSNVMTLYLRILEINPQFVEIVTARFLLTPIHYSES